MASKHADISTMVKQLRELDGKVAEQVAPEIARVVRAELERSIAAGTDPYGVAWKKTQQGATPLRNAMQAVTVATVDGNVFVRVGGIEARHHLGAVRGKVKRRIIPSKKLLPASWALAIKRVVDTWFQREVKNAG